MPHYLGVCKLKSYEIAHITFGVSNTPPSGSSARGGYLRDLLLCLAVADFTLHGTNEVVCGFKEQQGLIFGTVEVYLIFFFVNECHVVTAVNLNSQAVVSNCRIIYGESVITEPHLIFRATQGGRNILQGEGDFLGDFDNAVVGYGVQSFGR